MKLRSTLKLWLTLYGVAVCQLAEAKEVTFTKLTSERMSINAVAEKEGEVAGMSFSGFHASVADADGTHTLEGIKEYKSSVILGIDPSGTHCVGFVSIAFDKENPKMPSQQAFIFSDAELQLLPFPDDIKSPWEDVRLKSRAEGISDDGSVAVGCIEYGGRFQAIRWKEKTPQILNFPSSEYISSVAYDVSHDGSLVAGACSTKTDESVAVIWEDDKVRKIGEGMALAASPNGKHAVGVIDRNDGKPTAMLYSEGESITLESLAGFTGSMPHSVSNSGGTIVGQGLTGNTPTATVWLRAREYEPLDLNEVFREEMKREEISHMSSAKHISRDETSIFVICDDFSVYRVEFPKGYLTKYQKSANKTE